MTWAQPQDRWQKAYCHLRVDPEAPGWLSQLDVWLLISTRVVILGHEIQACVGLHPQREVCLGFSVSLYSSPPQIYKSFKIKCVYSRGQQSWFSVLHLLFEMHKIMFHQGYYVMLFCDHERLETVHHISLIPRLFFHILIKVKLIASY